MRQSVWLASVAALGVLGAGGGMLASGFVSAQEVPESILPPGFDDPAPAPTPAPAPAPSPSAAPTSAPRGGSSGPVSSGPVAPAAPSGGGASLPAVPTLSSEERSSLPSVAELESLSVEELDDRLGLSPKFDIPPAARRAMSEVGVIAAEEGGFPKLSLEKQPASLVRAVLAGTQKPMVSRWGHMLVRRALASRMGAPDGMNPVEFAALRAGVLNRMGEFTVARALVQDVDTGNWNSELTTEALTAYIAANDLTGACPAVRLQGSEREDAQWTMLRAICSAYAGETALAGSQLDSALSDEIAPEIDILLAQRFAGAAGRARRAVEIEWDGISDLNPWRFALANAVGEEIPAGLLNDALESADGAYYERSAAGAAMLPLAQREPWARRASSEGIFSAKAMVDFYSQIYADNTIGGDVGARASSLRTAYVAGSPSGRINAMQELWGENGDYAGKVATAYAAARIQPSDDLAGYSGGLITSMLAAGLDRDAAAWRSMIAEGSLGWALLAVGTPDAGSASADGVDTFTGNDDSEDYRASAFLVAGLAGLDRLGDAERAEFEDDLEIDLSRQTRWTQMIDRAADVNNPGLVALLAGLGMQGNEWSQMTPLHLYHIVSALRRVGLDAEARMIAAEAVARG